MTQCAEQSALLEPRWTEDIWENQPERQAGGTLQQTENRRP